MTGRRPIAAPVASSTSAHPRTSELIPHASVTGNSPVHSVPRPRGVPIAGARHVERISQGLSDRDRTIVGSVAAHRFLTTQQVERMHFADHTSALAGARAARRVLRRLADLGVLSHLERRVGGIRAGSAGYVWTLGPIGRRLHTARGSGRFRRYEPSLRLLAHYLAIADTHLALIGAARTGTFELLSVRLEPDSWRRFSGLAGDSRLLRPDLAAITSTGEYEDHWFLEVDLGTEHPPTVVDKCRLYLDYATTGTEQQALGVYPRVVWIVEDDTRAHALHSAFTRAGLDRALFRITTPDTLIAMLSEGAG